MPPNGNQLNLLVFNEELTAQINDECDYCYYCSILVR